MSARTACVSPCSHRRQPRARTRKRRTRSELTAWHVRDGIYMLVGAGGNTTVQVGDDGVLVVDTKLADCVGRRCSTRSDKSRTNRSAT